MSLDEEIYLGEDYFSRPKESFRFIAALLDELPGDRLLDLGCARGEFLNHLHLRSPGRWSRLAGVDLSPDLVADARQRLPAAPFSFKVGDLATVRLDAAFDCIVAAGVLGYLDDPASLTATAAAHAAPGAHLVVFGFLNMEAADAFTEFRYRGHREKANLHAHESLLAAAEVHGFAHCATTEFALPFPLARREDNIRRAWTIDTEYGRYFANGLGQYFRLYGAVFRAAA